MAIGTTASLGQEFVDVLSSELLLQPDAQFVFANLANASRAKALAMPDVMGRSGETANIEASLGNAVGTVDRMSAAGSGFAKVVLDPQSPGKTILIDRGVYLGGVFTEASRRLTEGTAIDVTAPIAPTMEQVPLTVREYAGPYDQGNSRVAPIGVTDMLKRRARHDVILYVGALLRRDRNAFVDRTIVDLLLSTSFTTTPDDQPADQLSAGDQPLREDTLAQAKKNLLDRGVPAFSNGNFICVLSPQHELDLRRDSAFREISRYQAEKGPLISGYLTTFGGFDFCISSRIPSVPVGAGGAVAGNAALCFGPEAIGWGVGMDVEARRSKTDDFGRSDMFVWCSEECYALLNSAMVERILTT